jgi:hypothetical protein
MRECAAKMLRACSISDLWLGIGVRGNVEKADMLKAFKVRGAERMLVLFYARIS